jgi:exodeoxyribonuclease VII large subunit
LDKRKILVERYKSTKQLDLADAPNDAIEIVSSVITVTELNRQARFAIEKALPSCWVAGEISNLTQASSGHWYFTLKDQQSSVKCAFFRNRNQFMDWKPTEGIKIEVRAQATLYEPRGDYQIIVEVMRHAGQGDVYAAFLRLKASLEAEGLFRQELKRAPPKYPKRIGIITSLQAAALQDALKTLQNRWPISPIVIYPTTVQGLEAADNIAQALKNAIQRKECEVLLLIRGGGSLEDLNAYNDENLARLIRSSSIPVITGIGHETDFSIADFSADMRAATPTAAAQHAVPDLAETRSSAENLTSRMNSSITRMMNQSMQYLDSVSRRLLHPGNRLTQNMNRVIQLKIGMLKNVDYRIQQLKHDLALKRIRFNNQRLNCNVKRSDLINLMSELDSTMTANLAIRKGRLESALRSLQQLNPENILSRGYCIVQTNEGIVVSDARTVQPGNKVKIILKSGNLDATVNAVNA